jgi:hypothetical protein
MLELLAIIVSVFVTEFLDRADRGALDLKPERVLKESSN